MAKLQEICVFRTSPAARLARSLAGRYALRVVELPESGARSRAALEEPTGSAVWLVDPVADPVALLRRLARRRQDLRLIAVTTARSANSLTGKDWFWCIQRNSSAAVAARAVASAFTHLELAASERAAREELDRVEREREELNRIGVALSATHDVGELLRMILGKTREITAADAGSVYVVETAPPGNGGNGKPERRLRFKLTQNDSQQFPFAEYTMPLTEESLAGYAALHGEVISLDDAYDVPPDRTYRFNPRYDQQTGYRTRSLLALPMKNARGEVIGVVQLLNCKRNPSARLLTAEDLQREVQPFPAHSVRLAESLASQAAVAYENSRLYQDIEQLFEGFVKAAVTAIEQRDPTTSGHSLRVSRMTCGLAEVADRSDAAPYRAIRFTPDQMKEIRYAALLHDFGKVGVREEILVKAKKLYPAQLDVIQGRFDYVRKELEASYERQKFRALLDLSRDEALPKIAAIEKEFAHRVEELDNAFAVIAEANEPNLLANGQFNRIFDIAGRNYCDPRGAERPLLTPDEVRFLSIRRGSLDSAEREQIESHVVHSFHFLMQIPWTREIRNIPEIARAHHEKINGTGYPYHLKGEEIPIQARMMTICDMFDALSASDRPYKKAVPAEGALAILEDSVAQNEIDAALFRLFLDARVFELLHQPA